MNKLTRGLSRSLKGSKPVKYRIVLFVKEVSGLPSWVSQAQIIWNRGQKIEQTEIVDVKNGKAVFDSTISHNSTMFQSRRSMESKRFTIRVVCFIDSYEGIASTTLKQQEVDMSKYVGSDQSEVPLEIKFSHHTDTVKISASIYSELTNRQDSTDLSSAATGFTQTTGYTQSTDYAPAPATGDAVFYADAPVQEQEEASDDVIIEQPEQPDVPEEENAPSQASQVIQGQAGLQDAISGTASTSAFQTRIDELNLEETGKKIGEGIAEMAFGERHPSKTAGLHVEIGNELVDQAVDQHLQSTPMKPIVHPLLKGMIVPLEDRIHHNLDMNFCQALLKVVFPWTACAKNRE